MALSLWSIMSHFFHPYTIIEGVNGAGKSTILNALKEDPLFTVHKPIFVREPGGTPAGESLRKVLAENTGLNKEWRSALLMAGRADISACYADQYMKVPIVSDRGWPSTYVYQSKDITKEAETIKALYDTVIAVPTLYILLDADPMTIIERQLNRVRTHPSPAVDKTTYSDVTEAVDLYRNIFNNPPTCIPGQWEIVDTEQPLKGVINQVRHLITMGN